MTATIPQNTGQTTSQNRRGSEPTWSVRTASDTIENQVDLAQLDVVQDLWGPSR